jgi:thiol-disulfide isomerase/thioredoxin
MAKFLILQGMILFLAFSSLADEKKVTMEIKFTQFTAVPYGSAPKIKIEDLKGKITLIDFWASWCKPCRQSIPSYNKIAAKYKDRGLQIIGINEDENVGDLDRFLKDVMPSFSVFRDPGKEMGKTFKVEALPTLFVLNRNVQIVAMVKGYSPKNEEFLEKQINEAIK